VRPPSIDEVPPSLLLGVRDAKWRRIVQAMIEIREIGPDELERWLALATAVRPDRAGSVGDYLDWKRQAEDMAWFVASVDGEDAGVAFAYVGWHSAPGTGTGEAFVLPEHRGAGVGFELYRELADWVQERGCITLETTVAEDDDASLAWADRRGFREVGRTSRMVLDLTTIEAPAVDPPEGVEIVTWAERPDLTHAIYEVACEAYPDEPSHASAPMDSFEAWLSKDMRGDSDRPDATFVALAGGEVAGYAKLSLSSSRTNVVMHDMTGVRRAYRRRGIASALKRAEIAWAKREGYEKLETSNEVRNEPIRRLNERHGYTVQPGVVVLHDSLAGID
jgi:mycothiol synthase